jgi:GLPGLI family protein
MKRIIFSVSVALIALMVLTSVTLKEKKSKQFRGTVSYAISYEGDAVPDVQKAKLPKTISIKMYDGMSKYDLAMGGVSQTIIENPTTGKRISLIEYGLKKAAYVEIINKAKEDSAVQYTTQIDYSSDTKMIAGYLCKKASVTFVPKAGVEDEERTYNVYYSEELSDSTENSDGPYAGINGMLLEFYQVAPGFASKYEATEVIKGKVKDLDFLLPSDFTEFTDPELLQKFLMGQ